MARQGYYTNPAEKKIEVFQRFDGGMNTVTADENMSDHESLKTINMDLVERGPLSRRHGMVRHLTPPTEARGQGFFRFYRTAVDYDEVLAVGGKLYKNGAELAITGLPGGFQTTRSVEAVQFQDRLWIATGTKLVEYDGTTAKVVTPYAPQPLEALYIGTNGLADDPDNYMSDGTATSMRIDGVTFSSRYGVVNKEITLTAYKSVPDGMAVEFQFEYRHTFMEEGKWLLGQDWGSSKTFKFKTDTEGDVQFRVNMRQAGLTVAEAQYLIPKYKIKPMPDPNDVNVPVERLDDCNRIVLHWNRIILYGDPTQPDAIFISHLNNPRYVPVPNSLRFQNGKNEALTSLVSFRDMLVGFTPSTIQALFGKSPVDFKRVTINTAIGCIASDTAKVMRNYIYFLSYDGVYRLKTIGFTEDKANVEKVDTNIANIVPRKTNACAEVIDGQYHVTFPDEKQRFRFYENLGAWTMDDSEKLDFHRMWTIGNDLYGQSIASGIVQKFDHTVFDDDGFVYTEVWESKAYDFKQPYHKKKLKELQVLVSPLGGDIQASVTVYADSEVVLDPDASYAQVNPDTGEVEWFPYFETNFNFNTGTIFGQWVVGYEPFGTVRTAMATLPISGKCYTMKILYRHTEAIDNTLIGTAIIFKLKKP